MHPRPLEIAPLVDQFAERTAEQVIAENAPFILWSITQGGRRPRRTLPELVSWFLAEFGDELTPGTMPSEVYTALDPFFL